MKLNMKKNKKYMVAIVITIILLIAIIFGIKLTFRPTFKLPELTLGEISDIKESELGDKDFYIYIYGAYWGELKKDELEKMGIKTYEFNMGVLENEKTITNTYKGFNLVEWLTKSHIDDFQTITFNSLNEENPKLSLDIEQIRDTMYIVLYKNGEYFNDKYRGALISYDSENQITFGNIEAIKFERMEVEE